MILPLLAALALPPVGGLSPWCAEALTEAVKHCVCPVPQRVVRGKRVRLARCGYRVVEAFYGPTRCEEMAWVVGVACGCERGLRMRTRGNGSVTMRWGGCAL